MSQFQSAPRRAAMLIIMDGVGLNPSRINNAVAIAKTPNLDRLYSTNPVTVLEASGAAVGLPSGQMGNSEVGHLTLGCGTVLRQDLVVINDSIADGAFYTNEAIVAACDGALAAGRPVHLLGLVSDGGVHSHLDHLLAIIEACRRKKVVPVLHMITDGRDTAPQCATAYLPELEEALAKAGGQIATVCGRYYAMDRDNRWERVQVAFDAMVHGNGTTAESAAEAINNAWDDGQNDEFIKPAIIQETNEGAKKGWSLIAPGDQVVFFNFRNDRPRELSSALMNPDFSEFERGDFEPVVLTTMTRYHDSFNCAVAFEKDKAEATLGKALESAGVAQFHSAETEKYPHVTFFFNGGEEKPYEGEERALIASPKVETYDLQPEMSAYEVRDAVSAAIQSGKYGFIVVNLANGDMVGHTGVREAVVKAVEVVDEIVGELVETAAANDFSVIVTADHGNADMLIDPVTGAPHTQHTLFPVACMVQDKVAWHLATGAGLSAIAPTLLQLMGIAKPKGMSGESLLLSEKTH